MDKDLIQKIWIDGIIELNEIKELYEEIKNFEPYGYGNEKPLFLTMKAQIVGYPEIIKNKINFRIRKNETVIEATAPKNIIPIERSKYINLVYELESENKIKIIDMEDG